MYNLHADNKNQCPARRLPRFKNFNASDFIPVTTEQYAPEPEAPAPKSSGSLSQSFITLPKEIREELARHEVSEVPQLLIRSPFSNNKNKGDSYAIAFKDFIVLMWRKPGQVFTVLKYENYEVMEVDGEAGDDDETIVLCVVTEHRTMRLWFTSTQTEELVKFINDWKVHTVDQKKKQVPVESRPEISSMAQDELPRTVIFGTLLIDQLSDKNRNITKSDLDCLQIVISNSDLLSMCVENFKNASMEEVRTVVLNHFTKDQRLMLISTMADLAHRDGKPHQEEVDNLNQLIDNINFPTEEFENLLQIFKCKNNPSILESY